MHVLSCLAFLATVTAAVPFGNHPEKADCVEGKVFNRFVVVWLENTDFEKAAGDPNLAFLATKGITLSNYFGVTHPSEPNYAASVSGDYYGMDNDDLNMIPRNISTVVDLLDSKRITWGEYQEDMPSVGFTGFEFLNPQTQANMYVRKHNPLVLYNSVENVTERLQKLKPLTSFATDLKAKNLPQWIFITPNMTSDGHDSSVTVAGTWTRNFIEPLLDNEYFMKDTLVLITFDENHTTTGANRVMGILMGDAVPAALHGTTDAAYYDHYSEIATVEANWDLPTLGRYDVGANVFSLVGKKTGDKIRTLESDGGSGVDEIENNLSYPGIFHSDGLFAPQPIPNTSLVINGRKVLQSVKDQWGSAADQRNTVYHGQLRIPTFDDPPK